MATIAECARHLDMVPGRFEDLVAAGVIEKPAVGGFVLDDVRAAYLNHLRARASGGVDRTVDDLWFLVEDDFAPALGFAVPKRRVFLGALQKLAGVQVQYDRRMYDRRGQLLRKTTFYRFAPMAEAATDKTSADLPLFAVAA